MTVGVIVGSAFDAALHRRNADSSAGPELLGRPLQAVSVDTGHGTVCLHRYQGQREAWVLFRHGFPHRWLPHQIPYRAHAAALAAVGCRALLVTSSVGVLAADLQVDAPLVVGDLMMLDNRLPTGEACTMFVEPTPGQGHLVLEEGLLSNGLSVQLEAMMREAGLAPTRRVVFAHVHGPRTKTAAENAWWRAAGADVNSMTVGPELVLANELGIPTTALVVGHKRSAPEVREDLRVSTVRAQLARSRAVLERLVVAWLERAQPVPFGNHLVRFDAAGVTEQPS